MNPEIIGLLQTWGYFVMLWLMIVEWPIITIIAAFLASIGMFDIYIVALLWWAGDMIGDNLFFWVGRWGIRIFQTKKIPWDLNQNTFFTQLDSLMHKNLLLSLFAIKFTPYAPPLWFAYIGRSNIAYSHFFRVSFLSCLPVPILAASIWFHLQYVQTLMAWRTPLEIGIIIAITLLLFWIVTFLFLKIRDRLKSILFKK